MAQVVFLRGVNVGGHRVFRPAQLPAALPHLGLVNIGAAGTLVVRRRVGRAALVRALRRQLPFVAEIIVCDGAAIRDLVAARPFARHRFPADVTCFVSVLGGEPDATPILPLEFRHGRRWLVKVLDRTGCFVLGAYRRHMRTIGLLGRVDKLFDVPVTTRNWNTMKAVAAALERRGA